jgi:nucleotide-binding universal stress UspA family protein
MNMQSCPIAKLEKLLVATACGDCSQGAIRESINLAKICSSKLYAVSVVETNPEYSALAMDAVEEAAKETKEHLESVKDRIEKEGVDCECIAHRGGDIHQHIIDDAKKNGADLILMGRTGRSGLKRFMMGSVTALVVGRAPCNVLVVPRGAGMDNKTVLVATDGSEKCEMAMRESISFAKRCGSRLIAISVARRDSSLETAKENVKHVKELAKQDGIDVETITAVGPPYAEIVNAAEEKNADLIVIGCKGKTGFKKLLMGSVAERVVALAHCAIMVVH